MSSTRPPAGANDGDPGRPRPDAPPLRLLLFDIDGTLLLSGGAGKRALNRAFREVFGTSDAFTGIPVAGRTDALIFHDAVARAGVAVTPATRARFFARYYVHLKQEIRHPGPNKGLMPGVASLLARLASRADVVLALLTGNFARAARIKLEHFALWRYFVCGAYGDDAPARDDLVPIAIARARAVGRRIVSPTAVVVIGDTPLDVQCAAIAGARSLAVATGTYGEDALHRAGADAVLPDLADVERVLAALRLTPGDGVDFPRPSGVGEGPRAPDSGGCI